MMYNIAYIVMYCALFSYSYHTSVMLTSRVFTLNNTILYTILLHCTIYILNTIHYILHTLYTIHYTLPYVQVSRWWM